MITAAGRVGTSYHNLHIDLPKTPPTVSAVGYQSFGRHGTIAAYAHRLGSFWPPVTVLVAAPNSAVRYRLIKRADSRPQPVRNIWFFADCRTSNATAVKFAVELAKRHGATITFLSVIEAPGVGSVAETSIGRLTCSALVVKRRGFVSSVNFA